MGNMFQIKLKNKIKVDVKQTPMNSSNSQMSVISETKINYDFEDDDSVTSCESESCFIERELNQFGDSECESESESEYENDANPTEESATDKANIQLSDLNEITHLDRTPSQNSTIQPPQRRKKGKKKGNQNKEKQNTAEKQKKEDNEKPVAQIKTTPFRGQDINEIRKKGAPFVDDVFKANVLAFTNSPSSEFGKQLIESYRCRPDLRDLNSKLVWKRPQVKI